MAHSEQITESRSAAVASGVFRSVQRFPHGTCWIEPDEGERDEREPDEGDEHREPRHPPPAPAHDGGRNPNELQRRLTLAAT